MLLIKQKFLHHNFDGRYVFCMTEYALKTSLLPLVLNTLYLAFDFQESCTPTLLIVS